MNNAFGPAHCPTPHSGDRSGRTTSDLSTTEIQDLILDLTIGSREATAAVEGTINHIRDRTCGKTREVGMGVTRDGESSLDTVTVKMVVSTTTTVITAVVREMEAEATVVEATETMAEMAETVVSLGFKGSHPTPPNPNIYT